MLHSVIGDHDRADADMEFAFALESTRDTPPLLARVRIDWAEVKLNRAAPDDVDRARDLLRAALASTIMKKTMK